MFTLGMIARIKILQVSNKYQKSTYPLVISESSCLSEMQLKDYYFLSCAAGLCECHTPSQEINCQEGAFEAVGLDSFIIAYGQCAGRTLRRPGYVYARQLPSKYCCQFIIEMPPIPSHAQQQELCYPYYVDSLFSFSDHVRKEKLLWSMGLREDCESL